MIQSFRYLHLANGHPLGAAVVGISLAALAGAMISWDVELLDLNRAVNLYAVLGVSAALVFALKIAFIKVKFEPKGVASIFWERWDFTKKATKLNVSIWLAGNLPWIILGVYLNQTLLGILRACLTLVNPIQTIERGFTNALLVDVSASNIDTPRLLKVFLRYIALFSSIYLCILTLWFFNAEAIVILTIGDKYLSYISSISVLLFIPIFQVISTFSSAILKSKHIFWPQTAIYIFTPALMVPAVWYFSSGDLPDPVVWVMALVAFIQAVFIFGFFIRTIVTVTEAVDAR